MKEWWLLDGKAVMMALGEVSNFASDRGESSLGKIYFSQSKT